MRTKGIIIKKNNSGEFDQEIFLYTEDFGKLRCLAKSILKTQSKQASHLNELNLIEFTLVKGKKNYIIASASSIETHSKIKKNIFAYNLSMFILEVLDKMVYEHDPDPYLYKFLLASLGYLNDIARNLDRTTSLLVLNRIQDKLLSILGYSNSKKEGQNQFDNVFESLAGQKFYSLQMLKTVLK